MVVIGVYTKGNIGLAVVGFRRMPESFILAAGSSPRCSTG
jgi:hypothetical protein